MRPCRRGPRSLRPSDGRWRSRGSASLFIRTRLRGLCRHHGEGPGFTGSRPKQAPLGTDPQGPGCGNRETWTLRPCGRACGLRDLRWTLFLPTSPMPGDLTSPLPLWPGPVPAPAWVLRETTLWGAAGGAQREAGVPRGLPKPQGHPLLAGTAATAEACRPGGLRASRAGAARNPLLSLPPFLAGGVCRRVCVPVLLYRALILPLPGSQNGQECPTWPEICLLALVTASPTVLEASLLCPLSLRVSPLR